MSLYLVSRSTVPVVSLVEAKAHLREDSSDQDTLIESLVAACTQHIDGDHGWLNRSIVDQTWDYALPYFGCEPIQLPLPLHISVDSIKFYDDANALQTVDVTDYEVVGIGGSRRAEIRLKSGESWPTIYDRAEPIVIRFRAGYLDMGDSPPTPNVPEPIKAAIKLMVGSLYANRETVVIGHIVQEIPWAAEALLKPYRVFA